MATIITGLPAAPGIGIGKVFIYTLSLTQGSSSQSGTDYEGLCPDCPSGLDPACEWQRFLAAREQAAQDLVQLRQSNSPHFDDIFASHQEILYDRTLASATEAAITSGQSAAAAIRQVTQDLVEQFEALSDRYFASRSADIRDVGQRLLSHLEGTSPVRQLANLPEETILVAEDLTPSDTTHLDTRQVVGIALAGSAPTAHTAILARSLGLPLVCGLGKGILALSPGQTAIVDSTKGELVIDPAADLLQTYRNVQQRIEAFRQAARSQAHEPAVTQDGVTIPVYANVNNAEEIAQVVQSGADGIGLLRTEHLFQYQAGLPTIQEELNAYRHIAQKISRQPLTIRTLDIGGDKPVSYLPQAPETNPFLGVRGARLALRTPELLRNQFHAIVRLAMEIATSQPIRVLVPMISQVEEVRKILAIFQEVKESCGYTKDQHRLWLGLMIEVPAAALLAQHLAPLVDFFSIGTNDLAQYTLAADRVNSAVASMATALDPSVLHLIKMTCQAAETARIPVSLCGEIAGHPEVVPLLLGLGVTELSVIPPALPLIKQAVRLSHLSQSRRLAEEALRCTTAEEVRTLLA